MHLKEETSGLQIIFTQLLDYIVKILTLFQ